MIHARQEHAMCKHLHVFTWFIRLLPTTANMWWLHATQQTNGANTSMCSQGLYRYCKPTEYMLQTPPCANKHLHVQTPPCVHNVYIGCSPSLYASFCLPRCHPTEHMSFMGAQGLCMAANTFAKITPPCRIGNSQNLMMICTRWQPRPASNIYIYIYIYFFEPHKVRCTFEGLV